MEEWKEYKLGDIYEVHNGLSKGGKFFGSGYPFLSFSTIFNNWFIPNELSNLVQSTDKEQESYSIKEGDVFITRTSETADELGMSCVALKDYPKATYNGFCKRMRQYNHDIEVNPKYIGYYLRNPNFRLHFQAFSGSMSTRASLTNEALLGLTVKIPPLPTQQKIAAILSSLDDKIELNNKININLEQQAQALFKNWFVDFEPFGGKMPEGWKVGKLSNLITVKYGKDHKKLDDGKYPVYGSGGIMRYVDKFLYDKESVLIPRKGTLNNVFYINEPFWSVDTVFYTEMKKENIAKYVYFFVKNKDLNAMNAGSAVPSMTTEILNAMEVIIPDDNQFEKFATLASPMFKQMKQYIMENKKLISLRDTLLPKLMNDEIEVDEVDL